jgi:hypothetical protein
MKQRLKTVDQLPEQNDLVVSFYDVAVDYRKESFDQIARRVLPKGFKLTPSFRKEALKMFELARLIGESREVRVYSQLSERLTNFFHPGIAFRAL